ncbi:MAG: hypothetical protein KF905_16550 [Flavobacteriales bacterium]|nr:hypothetical protein [Flavobacteriales bacterium]
MSVDSAIWYLEAALNYAQAQAWLEHSTLEVDSITYVLDLSGNAVSTSSVYAAYNEFVADLATYTTDDQHIHLVDLLESNGQLLGLVQVASGYAKNNPPNINYPANYLAWWCNVDNPVLCNTSNLADHVIRQRINSANQYALQPGQFFHSIETWLVSVDPTSIPAKTYWWRDPFMASPTPNNNGYRESLLYSWRDGAPLGGKCLNAVEMRYWTGNATTNGTWRAITKIRLQHCPNKLFTGCNMAGGAQTIPEGLYWIHVGTFTYALLASGGSNG